MIQIFDHISLAPPFDLDIAASAEPATKPIRVALRDFLLSITGLETLTDVYWRPPPNAIYPYMVFTRLWQSTQIVTNSNHYRESAYQFDIFAVDTSEVDGSNLVDAIGQAAYDALLPVKGYEKLLFSNGYEITRFPGPGKYHGPDAETEGMPGGYTVYRVHFDYTWYIGLD